MKPSAKSQEVIRVLVVDDESEIRDFLSDFLKSEGYTVQVAKSGNEALNKADQFLPDLVMLDIILPGLDGVGVYEALRKKKVFSDIPVIFFSTIGSESIPKVFARQLDKTPHALVKKPINPDLLMREVKKLLGK